MAQPLTFEGFPPLEEILEHGGIPGIEYAYILGKNIYKAEQEDWGTLHRVPSFGVKGPNGTVAMVLMGKGKPIHGADPNGGRCKLFVDMEGEEETGLVPKRGPGRPKKEDST